jgi:DNA-binding CsgD family transcriptional regulator
MGQRERNRSRERVEALAGSDLGADEIRREAIEALRPAVGFDRWCWPLTDPDSGLSVSGIGEFDFWPSLALMVALEESGDVTRKPSLVVGPRATVTLSGATRGDLARSRRWRECLHPYGIGDELMTACRDRHGCWGSVELMRDSSDAPFGEDETNLMEELAPTLGALLRVASFRAGRADVEDPPPRPFGVLILDRELRPVSGTRAFREWLADLPSAGPGGSLEFLPTAVYEIATRALTPPEATVGLPNAVRLQTRTGRWAVIEGDLLEGTDSGQVVITIRAATSNEVFDVLCKAHGLSPREQQLVRLLLAGLATKQLAQALFISPYTVQDHLKAIFTKTGVRTRRELVTHLTGRTRLDAATAVGTSSTA